MCIAVSLVLALAAGGAPGAAGGTAECRFPEKAFANYTLRTVLKRTTTDFYGRGRGVAFCTGFDVYVFTGASVEAEDADVVIRNLRGKVRFRGDLTPLNRKLERHRLPKKSR